MKEESIGSMKKIQSKLNKGMSTLEILLAFTILILTITAVIGMGFGNQSITVDSQISTEALNKASDLLEQARVDAKLDFNLVNPQNNITDDIYNKNLEVELLDIFTKKVTSIINWPTEGNRNLNISLSTLITNPSAVGGGDTCGSVLSGNWSLPEISEYEFGSEILNDTSSGFPITSIQAFNKKLYVTVNNTNGNNPGTFYILDISNPTNKPILLSPPLFDNSTTTGEGLNSVAVDGKSYAYVANAYTSAPSNCVENNNCSAVQVIKINDSSNPQIVKNVKINAIASGNKLPAANIVIYKDGFVYAGLAKVIGGSPKGEFNIIDVGGGGAPASPTNPLVRGTFNVGNGVNAISVKGNFAYIASPNNQELKILDISDPDLPVQVGQFDAPAGGGNSGNGKSLYLVGNKLYFGRTLLSGDEFYILNNINPETTLPIYASKNILDSDDGQPPAASNTTLNGILVRDYLAFFITNSEFQVWNIIDQSNITRYADPIILPPGSGNLKGTATDCEGNYIYVGSLGSNDKGFLSIITGGS